MAANNAIGWVQFKLIGGARNLGITSVAYGLFVIALMFLTTQLAYHPSFAALADGIPIFIGGQLVVLLLYGIMRVGHAVRLDVNSGMIESHRLMPVSPVTAILGYVFGSTVQALALFVINVVLGAVCVSAASLPARLWIVANGILLLYAILTWTIVAFFSFRFGGTAILMVITQLIVLPTVSTPLHIFPGLAILATPTMGRSIFVIGRLDTLPRTLLIAMALQAVIAAVYIIAAARRFARENVQAFDAMLSSLLLTFWTVASIVGVSYLQSESGWRRRMMGRDDSLYVFIGGFVGVVVLAVLPVASAVRARRTPPLLIAALSGAIACLMLSKAPEVDLYPLERTIATLVGVMSFLVTMRYVVGLAVTWQWWTRPIIGLWVFVFWIMPSIVDVMVSPTPAYQGYQAQPMTWVPPKTLNQIVSLPGMLYYCWNMDGFFRTDRAAIAAVIQVLLAILAAIAFYAFRRKPRLVVASAPIPALSIPVPGQLTPDGIA